MHIAITGATGYLGRYLEFKPQDIDERAKLAAILANPKLATSPEARQSALFVLEQVVSTVRRARAR